jgi:hypothetical protein
LLARCQRRIRFALKQPPVPPESIERPKARSDQSFYQKEKENRRGKRNKLKEEDAVATSLSTQSKIDPPTTFSLSSLHPPNSPDFLHQAVHLASEPPTSSTFLSEQISHQQSVSSTFLSEHISSSHWPSVKLTGCTKSLRAALP